MIKYKWRWLFVFLLGKVQKASYKTIGIDLLTKSISDFNKRTESK